MIAGVGRVLVLLTSIWAAAAADTKLDLARASLLPMRGTQLSLEGPRGATPQLTVAKHRMLDWVESHLKGLGPAADEKQFAEQMNAVLDAAGLTCQISPGDRRLQQCPEWGAFHGYLGKVDFRRPAAGYLSVRIPVGISCGYDDSVYLYNWHNISGWKRVWRNEQNTYTEQGYTPQTVHAVLLSPGSAADAVGTVVLTLGSKPWCSSMWQTAYYRAFRLDGTAGGAELVSGAESSYQGVAVPIQGSVTPNDVLIEFRTAGIDVDLHNRPAIRHYRIEGKTARRIEPFALSPRDFVDEWLSHSWADAQASSDSTPLLAEWHRKLHRPNLFATFVDPTMRCPGIPGVWQVAVDSLAGARVTTYFLVRWQQPYRFTLIGVSNQKSPACTLPDATSDDPDRSMFRAVQ